MIVLCNTQQFLVFQRRTAFNHCACQPPCATLAKSPPSHSLFKDGNSFSPLINGTWQLAGGHGRAVFDHVFDKLRPLSEAGFTTYDTADIYGPSEEILGQLQSMWTAAGNHPLQLFTKYVPNLRQGQPRAAQVREAIKKSCKALKTLKLDLLQLHWWDYSVSGMMDVLFVLADLQAEGMIRSIGVTNMDTHHLEKITDADIMLVSNQVQFSLLDRRPLGANGMLQLCKERGLKVLAYGVIAGGLLSDRYMEPSRSSIYGRTKYKQLDLDTASLKMYWNVVKRFGGELLWRRLLSVLQEVADKHKTSVSSVAIQWVMSQAGGGVVYPIIGVRHADFIENNSKALELEMDSDDYDYIDEVLLKALGPTGDIFSFERL